MQIRTFVKGLAAASLLSFGVNTLKAKTKHMPLSNNNTPKRKKFLNYF